MSRTDTMTPAGGTPRERKGIPMLTRNPVRVAALVVLLSAGASAGLAGTTQFIPLDVECGFPFFPTFCVVDMAGDGKTILYQGAVWSEASGMTPIGAPQYGFATVALSDDGSTVVGTIGVDTPELGLHEEAAIWRGGDTWQPLGGLPGAFPCGTNYTTAFDVSGDGSKVVGLAWIGAACENAHGFEWTEAGGMADLGAIVDGRASRANGISADGSTIVGWNDQQTGGRAGAFWAGGNGPRWFKGEGARIFAGEAQGVSSDGAYIAGGNYNDPARPNSYVEPWLWSEATGVVPLGMVKGLRGDVIDGQHYATDVSDDGRVVVGQDTLFITGEQLAWIWTSGHGIELLGDFVRRTGDAAARAAVCPGQLSAVQPCGGWKLWNVAAVSNDGTMLVGTGVNPQGLFEAFMVKIAP
jgi:hypothetical protein